MERVFARWKEGIAGITALQMTKQQLNGMRIILLGIICGITVCFFNIKNLWWLCIILIGSLYVNVTQYIGTWQKLRILKRFEIPKEEPFDKGVKLVCSNKDSPFEELKGMGDL